METIIVFARYSVMLLAAVAFLFYVMYFISGYSKVYVVFHTYLDDRRIVINKDVEKRIIKELKIKYPYKNSLTIKVDKINEIEESILRTIKNEYEKEININIVKNE